MNIDKDDLVLVMKFKRKIGYAGFNVKIPFKICDQITPGPIY